MTVELSGEADDQGMLLDFRALKRLMQPLVDQWDHATLVAESDAELLEVVRTHGWRHFVLPHDSTAENLCQYAARYLSEDCSDSLPVERLRGASVTIEETRNSRAKYSIRF